MYVSVQIPRTLWAKECAVYYVLYDPQSRFGESFPDFILPSFAERNNYRKNKMRITAGDRLGGGKNKEI